MIREHATTHTRKHVLSTNLAHTVFIAHSVRFGKSPQSVANRPKVKRQDFHVSKLQIHRRVIIQNKLYIVELGSRTREINVGKHLVQLGVDHIQLACECLVE